MAPTNPLREIPCGGVLLGIAAIGLLAFDFFEIIEATARRARAVKLKQS
jgi:hypothetical protein